MMSAGQPTPPPKLERRIPQEHQFQPGYYRHYKGDFYYAYALAYQNEMTDPRIQVVFYFSLKKQSFNTRPFNDDRYDSWADEVLLEDVWTPRFQYVDDKEARALLDEGKLGGYARELYVQPH